MSASDSRSEQPEWVRYAEARKRILASAVKYCAPKDGRGLLGPDFICIGAAKTGTSWLYDVLRRHPLVWLPPIKEISYFTSHYVVGSMEYFRPRRQQQVQDARRYWGSQSATPPQRPRWDNEALASMQATLSHLETDDLTDEWYQGIFKARDPDQVAGDISPDYALMPRAGIRHVLSLNPHARIIVLLRDPIERLVSHGAMTMGAGMTLDSLREVMLSRRADNWRMVSDYGFWLPRWLAAFDRSRILIEYNGRIGRDPMGALERICRFIGVPFDSEIFPGADRKVYEGKKPEDVQKLIEELRGEYSYLYDNLDRLPADIARDLKEYG